MLGRDISEKARFVIYHMINNGFMPPVLKPLKDPRSQDPDRARPSFALVYILPVGRESDNFYACNQQNDCMEHFDPKPAVATFKQENGSTTSCSIHVRYYYLAPAN